jgi:hypothetical protein
MLCVPYPVPPAGFEPAHRAPEARALSPELRGLSIPQTKSPDFPRFSPSPT